MLSRAVTTRGYGAVHSVSGKPASADVMDDTRSMLSIESWVGLWRPQLPEHSLQIDTTASRFQEALVWVMLGDVRKLNPLWASGVHAFKSEAIGLGTNPVWEFVHGREKARTKGFAGNAKLVMRVQMPTRRWGCTRRGGRQSSPIYTS